MNGDHHIPTYDDILDAQHRLRKIASATPVLRARPANKSKNAQLFFKCDNLQRTGATMFRGAYNALSCLGKAQRQRGVVAYSTGNHALAVAEAAQLLRIPATILMPSHTPLPLVAQIRDAGAMLILCDPAQGDCAALADLLCQQNGLTILPPAGHPDIAAGYGTAAKELFEAVGPLDYLFVPAISGGLLAACAVVAAEHSTDCLLVGVTPQSNQAPLMTPPPGAADDEDAQTLELITVNDQQISRQMRFLAEEMKILVEPHGALAAAASFDDRFEPGARVGVMISGGNTSLAAFSQMVGIGAPSDRDRLPRLRETLIA